MSSDDDIVRYYGGAGPGDTNYATVITTDDDIVRYPEILAAHYPARRRSLHLVARLLSKYQGGGA
jgi:hypothetical protein